MATRDTQKPRAAALRSTHHASPQHLFLAMLSSFNRTACRGGDCRCRSRHSLLCFLSPDTFVGFVELEHEGQRHVLKLTGSEHTVSTLEGRVEQPLE